MPQATRAIPSWPLVADFADQPLDCLATLDPMETPSRRGTQRKILAFVLVVLAIGLVVLQAIPNGVVLLTVTATHGVHAGDLPVLALLLAASWLDVW